VRDDIRVEVLGFGKDQMAAYNREWAPSAALCWPHCDTIGEDPIYKLAAPVPKPKEDVADAEWRLNEDWMIAWRGPRIKTRALLYVTSRMNNEMKDRAVSTMELILPLPPQIQKQYEYNNLLWQQQWQQQSNGSMCWWKWQICQAIGY
jgi:hypothetical protein